ncbi:MAG: hypothetical protein LBU70_09970 [Chitinispirillales bacterium]|jgi:hypothetical protein|nr:hypothetical protein [Chitinispirillales bacterium]
MSTVKKHVSANSGVSGTPTPEGYITTMPKLSENYIEDFIAELERVIEKFMSEVDIDTNLSGKERMRLFGVKSRNYGFISKAFEIARDHPNFAPGNFSIDDMAETLRILEQVRDLSVVVEQLQRITGDYLLLTSDNAYRDALRVYGNLREQNRARVAGASALFDELLQFFTLHRRGREGAEPTEKQLERDFRSLLHGHKDGKIVIENVSPKMTGGIHEVIDDVHKGKAAFKAEERGEV